LYDSVKKKLSNLLLLLWGALGRKSSDQTPQITAEKEKGKRGNKRAMVSGD